MQRAKKVGKTVDIKNQFTKYKKFYIHKKKICPVHETIIKDFFEVEYG